MIAAVSQPRDSPTTISRRTRNTKTGIEDGTPIVPDETEMELARYNAWSYGTTGQDGLGGLVFGSATSGPYFIGATGYGAPGAEGPAIVPVSTPFQITQVAGVMGQGFLQLSPPCSVGHPPDVEACATAAQLGFFGGFASLYNGVQSVLRAPGFPSGPDNYFDNEESSPH